MQKKLLVDPAVLFDSRGRSFLDYGRLERENAILRGQVERLKRLLRRQIETTNAERPLPKPTAH